MSKAGELDRRITIQRFTQVDDGYSAGAKVWADLTTVWAGRNDLSDRETVSAGQVNASLIARFKVRSSTVTRTVTAADRISYDGAVWGVQGVKETTEGRKRFLWISTTRQAD